MIPEKPQIPMMQAILTDIYLFFKRLKKILGGVRREGRKKEERNIDMQEKH